MLMQVFVLTKRKATGHFVSRFVSIYVALTGWPRVYCILHIKFILIDR